MQGDSPYSTKNKANAIQSLFPNKLPKDFAKSFDPEQFGSDSSVSRIELLKMMSAKPEHAMDILAMWKAMFPDDDWIELFVEKINSQITLE